MRPERLEMEGFAPFRERVSIDFSGLELFALTGPTGAGKSSVIDAIVFALYGTVPRHGKRSVAPVVTLGKADARVQFDFEVEGVAYTIVRKVQRRPTGGVGSEARLEQDGDVLASGSEVTSAIERLLGLGIEHFTRSVVLPQGEFAAFLHDTPAGQQDLVKALLDMGVLDTVRSLSTERARSRAALAEQAGVRLDQLADATEAAEKEAKRRVDVLEKLVDTVEAAESAIAESEALVAQRRTETENLTGQARLLASLSMPAGADELSRSLASLDERIETAREQLVVAEQVLEQVRTEAGTVPSSEVLERASNLHRRLDEAVARRDAIDVATLEVAVESATVAVTEARDARREAIERLDEARTRHAAHALVAGLSSGKPCPVCEQPLPRDPEQPPADLEERSSAVASAETALEAAALVQRRAEAALAEGRAGHEAAIRSVADLEEQLDGLPARTDLEDLTSARREIDRRLGEAEEEQVAARRAASEATAARSELQDAAARAWKEFEEARDRLAVLQPPPAERDDLARAWSGLTAWARRESTALGDKLTEAKAALDDASAAAGKQREELERILTEVGVDGKGAASARLAGAVATARAELERVGERARERQALEADRKQFTEEAAVASSLAQHLRADRFEGWLLAEALATLVDGANNLLDELTAGAYSLALDDRTIEVVDHRNADEHRSVRSLSGGETFLVSLALALSLGEQLTNLSDRGGARLEAIFLDEGFGSLDAETLETVTGVVSELAAQGRIVGVVTHVKELAEQMPVRFEVRTGASASTIERVEQ